MLAAVPEEKQTRGASRYDAVVATFVGFLALCVSGYTAYMQRQQVRAAVWPILVFDKSNPLWVTMNKERFRVTAEICYCSTLDECWTLRAGGFKPGTTVESRRCPTTSALSFQQ